MSAVLDEGLALFAGLHRIPKRDFLTEYSCRIDPACYPTLLKLGFEARGTLGLGRGHSLELDFIPFPSLVKTPSSKSIMVQNAVVL